MQFVVNTNLLRELDERKLINTYARRIYTTDEDCTNEIKIRENLTNLFDWDKSGTDGLALYCSKFESLKRKDWQILIDCIKTSHPEIKRIASSPAKQRRLNLEKVIKDESEAARQKIIDHFNDENYEVSNRGVPAKPCTYKGKTYKSRKECQIKENLSGRELYKYLRETNQI